MFIKLWPSRIYSRRPGADNNNLALLRHNAVTHTHTHALITLYYYCSLRFNLLSSCLCVLRDWKIYVWDSNNRVTVIRNKIVEINCEYLNATFTLARARACRRPFDGSLGFCAGRILDNGPRVYAGTADGGHWRRRASGQFPVTFASTRRNSCQPHRHAFFVHRQDGWQLLRFAEWQFYLWCCRRYLIHIFSVRFARFERIRY